MAMTPCAALATTVAAIALLTACSSDESGTDTTSAAIVVPFSVPSCDEQATACHLTKDSGVHGVPLPDDAAVIEGSDTDFLSSELGSIGSVTRAYTQVMEDNGWEIDEVNSEVDPDRAEERGLGHITNVFFCKTNPERWVSIIIGDYSFGGIKLGVFELDGETGCATL